jgi:lipid-A-disaccharide synthase-like uncharacterized protein
MARGSKNRSPTAVKKRWTFAIEIVLLLAVCGWAVNMYFSNHSPSSNEEVGIKIQLPGMQDGATLFKNSNGVSMYRVFTKDGNPIEYTADDFARKLLEAGRTRSAWEKLLNISSPEGAAWVIIGLVGQVLFTGRMIVQLLASEKEKKSVVPPAFWWMSLIGASMLLIYFGWRRDPIGLLGQSFGWFIYIRNLYLIYSKKNENAAATLDRVELKAEPAAN